MVSLPGILRVWPLRRSFLALLAFGFFFFVVGWTIYAFIYFFRFRATKCSYTDRKRTTTAFEDRGNLNNRFKATNTHTKIRVKNQAYFGNSDTGSASMLVAEGNNEPPVYLRRFYCI